MTFTEHQQTELRVARAAHPPLHSPHEAYAVILEEVRELEAEIFNRNIRRRSAHLLRELVQVAAMCQRAAEDLTITEPTQ